MLRLTLLPMLWLSVGILYVIVSMLHDVVEDLVVHVGIRGGYGTKSGRG